jgi:hypothetical protein
VEGYMNDISHRRRRVATVLLLLSAGGMVRSASAQNPAADSAWSALRQLGSRLDSLEAGQCPAAAPMALPAGADSLSTAVRALAERLERVRATRCAGAAADTGGGDDLAAIRAAAAAAAGGGPAGAPARTDTAAAGPVQFVGKQRNASALNPEISATGDIRLVARDGRQRDNGVAREFEVALQSALDPYASTKIFLTFSDQEVGVEEGYVYWTGLPGRLRADVGKFRQQIGDLNRWHLHALPESDYPLVYQRFLGEEGLSGIGLSLYTTLPFSLLGATHEIWVQGTTAESQGLLANSRQPTLLGRLQNFWQLSRSTYGQIGFTAAGGNNADSAFAGRLIGADLRLTWRPPSAGTRRELTFRAEGYRLHSDESGVVTNRYGGFGDISFRASRRWVLGVRGDWVESPRGATDTEWAVVPTLTWWESEFVYLRLEGRHGRSDMAGEKNEVQLQVVWAMGPHKHETY